MCAREREEEQEAITRGTKPTNPKHTTHNTQHNTTNNTLKQKQVVEKFLPLLSKIDVATVEALLPVFGALTPEQWGAVVDVVLKIPNDCLAKMVALVAGLNADQIRFLCALIVHFGPALDKMTAFMNGAAPLVGMSPFGAGRAAHPFFSFGRRLFGY